MDKDKLVEFIIRQKQLAFQFLINNVLDDYFNKEVKLKKETFDKLMDILKYINNPLEKNLYSNKIESFNFDNLKKD